MHSVSLLLEDHIFIGLGTFYFFRGLVRLNSLFDGELYKYLLPPTLYCFCRFRFKIKVIILMSKILTMKNNLLLKVTSL
jgi:hypothetical protein